MDKEINLAEEENKEYIKLFLKYQKDVVKIMMKYTKKLKEQKNA